MAGTSPWRGLVDGSDDKFVDYGVHESRLRLRFRFMWQQLKMVLMVRKSDTTDFCVKLIKRHDAG